MTRVVLKRHGKDWKPEEDALLIALYHQKKSMTLITERLSRSLPSVRVRASKLKLTSGSRLWTPSEDAIVKKHFFNWNMKDIAAMLGRTVMAVSARAYKLGLRHHRMWTSREENYVRTWYRQKPVRRIAQHLNRSEGSIRHRAYGLGLAKSTPRKHWTENDLAYLRKNLAQMTHEELAQQLGRTTWAIGAKASRLRLLKKLWLTQ